MNIVIMGVRYFDQYTYLHFAMGIIVYFWNVSLVKLTLLHIIFEIVENSNMGMHIINKYMVFWPGGKPTPDTITNIIGDNLGAILGWLSAYYLDILGNKYGWYFTVPKTD